MNIVVAQPGVVRRYQETAEDFETRRNGRESSNPNSLTTYFVKDILHVQDDGLPRWPGQSEEKFLERLKVSSTVPQSGEPKLYKLPD